MDEARSVEKQENQTESEPTTTTNTQQEQRQTENTILSSPDSPTNTTAATPKLKLTFNLAKIRAATPTQATTVPTPTPQKSKHNNSNNNTASSSSASTQQTAANKSIASFIESAKAFKCRRWSLTPIQIKLSGRPSQRTLKLPTAWTCLASARHPTNTENPTTFVCTWKDCHRIFDKRAGWKRHQHTHKHKQKRKEAMEKDQASVQSQ